MMAEAIPFIGREDELETVDTLIGQWGTVTVLCVGGPGGIGKTRLLQEIMLRPPPTPKLLTTGILDFDTPRLRVPGNLELEIARRLGQQRFQPYIHQLRELQQMQKAGLPDTRLEQEEQTLRDIFDQCYHEIARKSRLLVLMDTLEDVQDTDVWYDISDLIQREINTLFVLSGRRAERAYTRAQKIPQIRVEPLIELDKLSDVEASAYIDQKETRLNVSFDPDVRERLIKIAEGKPILIDLASEWLARAIPLSWMVNKQVEDLAHLTEEEQRDFEARLVQHIGELRKPLDELILDMAYVYPINEDIILRLGITTKGNLASLLRNLEGLVFVKPLPGNNYMLHDVMREMVNDYVWSQIDSTHDRRRDLSTQMVGYYAAKAEEHAQKLSDSVDEKEFRLEDFLVRDALRREYWIFREQQLFHQLWADLEKGYKLFNDLFEEATDAYQLPLRSKLTGYIEGFVDQLNEDQQYEVYIRKVKCLLDAGRKEDISTAYDILYTLMQDYADGSEREIDMLTRLANCAVKLGRAPQAIEYLEHARAISEVRAPQWLSKILNKLGQTYRFVQRLDLAHEAYQEALKYAHDKITIASVYNNLGYVESLRGEYEAALRYCERARIEHERLGMERRVGMSHANIGSIYRYWGNNDKALEHYNKALEIFEPGDDREWLACVYAYRAAVYRITAKTDVDYAQAIGDLEKSLEQGSTIWTPYAKHVLGCVYWSMGDLDKALDLFAETDEIARQNFDMRNHVNNVVGAAEIYFQKWETDPQETYKDEVLIRVEEFQRIWDEGYHLIHYKGRLERILGHMAYAEGQLNEALGHYAVAYPLLASRYAGYGPHTFQNELNALETRIDQLPPETAIAWCDHLEQEWAAAPQRREDLLSVCQIHRTDARLRMSSTDQGG